MEGTAVAMEDTLVMVAVMLAPGMSAAHIWEAQDTAAAMLVARTSGEVI